MRVSLVLMLLMSGCAAARSGYFLLNAGRELEKARDVGAEKSAPYEYTLAAEYYHKAAEENTYSEFGAADQLAKASQEWSARAIEATSDAEKEFGEDFVPEEKQIEVREKKENTLDQIDLDEL